MKQIASNYSYSPTTNVVTLTGVNIDADQLLLIVAPEVSRTMYNFASVTGVVSAGADTRVTLNASTAGLTTTSPLVIFYDDQASTQTIAGTVTIGGLNLNNLALGSIAEAFHVNNALGPEAGVHVSWWDDDADESRLVRPSQPLPIGGSVTVGNSVTIGSLPAISGTVTANVGGIASGVTIPVRLFADLEGGPSGQDTLLNCNAAGSLNVALPSTAGGTNSIAYDGTFSYVQVKNVSSITVGNSVTIGAMPNGTLTTRFGTPTTANTAFATSAVTNANRKYLLIQNVTTGSNVITVGIGFTPTTTQGIQLAAGAGITFESSYIPTGAVQILSSVTQSNFTILEA